jgi:hypothetical protein
MLPKGQNTGCFDIYYLLFTIYYFSLAFMAQTTLLISVNPCLTEHSLKKQTQFKPNQTQFKNPKRAAPSTTRF